MEKANLIGQRYERLEVLMPAWINEKQNQVWMCVCDCGQIRFMATAVWNSKGRQSCGCLRKEKAKITALAMNSERAGKPRSTAGKLASFAACKKMNEVRRLKARHILDSVDPEQLTAVCRICGPVPIKVMKHRANEALRDQYLCWVGSLRVNNAYAAAKVRFSGHALEMFENQKNACAVCGGQMIRGDGLANEGMVLDHCHTSGFIRGFLHQGCNKGLGHFLDNPATLRKAAEYLERTPV